MIVSRVEIHFVHVGWQCSGCAFSGKLWKPRPCSEVVMSHQSTYNRWFFTWADIMRIVTAEKESMKCFVPCSGPLKRIVSLSWFRYWLILGFLFSVHLGTFYTQISPSAYARKVRTQGTPGLRNFLQDAIWLRRIAGTAELFARLRL